MRVRVGARRAAKRIPLGNAAGFGIAPVMLLDFGEQQAQAPLLLYAFGLGNFDLMTGFACEAGIE